jgi:hypothetical protein
MHLHNCIQISVYRMEAACERRGLPSSVVTTTRHISAHDWHRLVGCLPLVWIGEALPFFQDGGALIDQD